MLKPGKLILSGLVFEGSLYEFIVIFIKYDRSPDSSDKYFVGPPKVDCKNRSAKVYYYRQA